MYMDVLEHEVEALNEEVTRLRQMVHRVTQFIEPPIGESAVPTYGDPNAVPLGQSAQPPTPVSAFISDTAPHRTSAGAPNNTKGKKYSRNLQALIEGCTLDLLDMLAAFREDASLNPKAGIEKILKSHYKDRKILKHETKKRHHTQRHRRHSSSSSPDPSSSSSSSLSAPKPRPSRDPRERVQQAVSGDAEDGRAAVVESRPPAISEPVAIAFAKPAPQESPSTPPLVEIAHVEKTSIDVAPLICPNQAPFNASALLDSIGINENRAEPKQEVASQKMNAQKLSSESSKEGLPGLGSQPERSNRLDSMIFPQEKSLSTESSSTIEIAPKSLALSGVHERAKPASLSTHAAAGSLSEDSTSEDDLDPSKGPFGVRSDRPEQGIRSPKNGVGPGTPSPDTTSPGRGERVHTMQLRPSVLEFFRKQAEGASTLLSDLSDVSLDDPKSQARAEREVALATPRPFPEPLSKGNSSDSRPAAGADKNSGGPYTPIPESPLDPSRSSLQFSGYGQAGVSANSVVGDYDFGFDLANRSALVKSQSLPSFLRAPGNSGIDSRGL